jgi:hypothetical protein
MGLEQAIVTGTYFVRTKFIQGIPTPYTIQWSPFPGGFCLDDDFEPNDRVDDSPELPGEIDTDLKLCGHDDDWFSFPVAPGTKVEVTLLSRGEAPPVLEIFDDREIRRVGRDDGDEESKSIVYRGDHVGNLFVRVSQEDADARTNYALHFVTR